jgi:hypothetical protein
MLGWLWIQFPLWCCLSSANLSFFGSGTADLTRRGGLLTEPCILSRSSSSSGKETLARGFICCSGMLISPANHASNGLSQFFKIQIMVRVSSPWNLSQSHSGGGLVSFCMQGLGVEGVGMVEFLCSHGNGDRRK